ncbi:NAD-dependent epimerase/dehydratase family protein [Actinomycetospora endophytica]|uniref:NAD-dependent epimerase/dehydratase family protein n=1 Tax=Actinomycetospora endophytica TaxID=2291215 RepID=A0ABS8PG56_9PSEU|nr:NAD-dependent epimerase/dehydratase family protein [Actinomycetospora endophytica]MCD2196993.1 NAD-dependent epimerase/dehydratase family protein [Actinomycetospora endophytica]
MRVLLTGATGFLGSSVLSALLAGGHDVVAPVRRPEVADDLARRGVTAVVGDLTDSATIRPLLEGVDGVIHAASPNDATSAALDGGFLDVVLPALAGSGAAYVHTGGTWVYGSGKGITEDDPTAPPLVVAWRPAVNDRVLGAAADGIRSVVIAPANLYGQGRGIPALLAGGPVRDGRLLHPGSGDQHVAAVAAEDVAALYVLALTSAPAGSTLLAAEDGSPTMREVAEAAARGRGLAGVAAEPEDETRGRIGPMTDPLLLDQQVDASAARSLGWRPGGPGLLADLERGSYAGSHR